MGLQENEMRNEQTPDAKQAAVIESAQRLANALAIAENRFSGYAVSSEVSNRVIWQKDAKGEHPVVSLSSGITVVFDRDMRFVRLTVDRNKVPPLSPREREAYISRDHAIEVGSRVTSLLKISNSVVLEDATFFMANPRDNAPSWMLRWARQVNGIVVHDQGIGVTLSAYGGRVLDVGSMIREDTAFKSALGTLDITAATSRASQAILRKFGVSVDSPAMAKKVYVNPDMFRIEPMVSRTSSEMPSEYLCAWHLYFSVGKDTFTVWLDAHTGRILRADRSRS
jgi:hypothetical protein